MRTATVGGVRFVLSTIAVVGVVWNLGEANDHLLAEAHGAQRVAGSR